MKYLLESSRKILLILKFNFVFFLFSMNVIIYDSFHLHCRSSSGVDYHLPSCKKRKKYNMLLKKMLKKIKNSFLKM